MHYTTPKHSHSPVNRSLARIHSGLVLRCGRRGHGSRNFSFVEEPCVPLTTISRVTQNTFRNSRKYDFQIFLIEFVDMSLLIPAQSCWGDRRLLRSRSSIVYSYTFDPHDPPELTSLVVTLPALFPSLAALALHTSLLWGGDILRLMTRSDSKCSIFCLLTYLSHLVCARFTTISCPLYFPAASPSPPKKSRSLQSTENPVYKN